MNKRIKQLAEQATTIVDTVNSQGYSSFYAHFNREKFAELIVRECADIATIHQQNHAHDSIGRYVLDHFGVKE